MGEQVTPITPETPCANCKGGVHRWLIHAGPKRLCQMASCGCTGFVAGVEPVFVEPLADRPTATMTPHGHSHKRMTLVVKYNTDRRFPVYLWLKDGKPCGGC
jgi:hypothetical protein